MTYDRDYILRMVREFARTLARIVRSPDTRDEARTVADLEPVAQQFVGLGLEALEALPSDELIMMLSLGGPLDVNRAYAAGRLLDERGRMAASSGDHDASFVLRRKALHLLVGAAREFGEVLNEAHEEALDRVALYLVEARPTEIPPRLLCNLLEVEAGHDDAEPVRAIAAALLQAHPEARDPMTALRIALRGACGTTLGRVEELLGQEA